MAARRTPKKAGDVSRVPFLTLCAKEPTQEELLALRWSVLALYDALGLIQRAGGDRHTLNARIVAELDRRGLLPPRLTAKLRDGGYYVLLTGRGADPVDALLHIAEKVNVRAGSKPEKHQHAAIERVHRNISRYRDRLESGGEKVLALASLPTLAQVKARMAERSRQEMRQLLS